MVFLIPMLLSYPAILQVIPRTVESQALAEKATGPCQNPSRPGESSVSYQAFFSSFGLRGCYPENPSDHIDLPSDLRAPCTAPLYNMGRVCYFSLLSGVPAEVQCSHLSPCVRPLEASSLNYCRYQSVLNPCMQRITADTEDYCR
ncbi:uncharacterized protein LOC130273008 isoform X2 [Hyla sarda]|uniref:uncharacterized protein LOC130273008 isoform X2 n=1 Tax=Hyla sarda TaxID=327740 RepID=UPI0024C28B0B|nr:uncharacterized protein LOC130273008 isoform X2 [Hyla sarda]